MAIYPTVKGETRYPLGTHMLYNLPIIESMAFSLCSVIEEHYKDKSRIHLVCRGSSGAIISGVLVLYSMSY
jgi:hypothetical protein